MFRFYTTLNGWNEDSYGSQYDDSPIDYNWDVDVITLPLVRGKGLYSFPDFPGGKVRIKVVIDDYYNYITMEKL